MAQHHRLSLVGALLFLAAISLVSSQTLPVARMCTISDADQAFCTSVASLMNSAALTFGCIQSTSNAACMAAIQAGDADWRTFAAAEMYTANLNFDLKTVVAEDMNVTGQVSTTYYSVAVVKAAFCTAGVTLADLRGKTSCHTAYRRNAGWQNPIGYLAGSAIMPIVRGIGGVADDAESVANFFSGSCASNFLDSRGRQWAPMCSACYRAPGTTTASCTTPAERYSDYPGSFRGMMDGACDVSFTRNAIPNEYTVGGALADTVDWATGSADEYRLLCATGGCAAITDFASCNLGRVPADAVMVRSGYEQTEEIKTALLAASGRAAFRSRVFSNATTGGNPANLLFRASTVQLLRVDDDTKAYLGNSVVVYRGNALLTGEDASVFVDPAAPETDPGTPVARVCTISAADQAFCTATAPAMNSAALTYSCVQRASDAACMAAIQAGDADWRTYAAADIYTASTQFDLKVVVAEDQGNFDVATTYFSVGVVRAEFCSATTTLADLRGKRSCHTAYRRNAGWQIPVGFLAGSGVMPIVRGAGGIPDDAESVASFFSGSCASNFLDNRNRTFAPLCSACYTDAANPTPSCRTPAEPYSDYPGAFRGVVEGACDVAFTQSRIPLELSTDGSDAVKPSWSTKPMSDFRLICPTGGCAAVQDYATCNLGRVPADAVMVRSNWPLANVLKTSLLAASASAAVRAAVFNTTTNPSSFIFKSSTVRLLRVDDDTKAYLGNSFTVYKGNEDLYSVGANVFIDPTLQPVVGVPTNRMCTISAAEQALCNRLVPLMNSGLMTFSCVQFASDPACMVAIQSGLADSRTFAAAEMYTANNNYDLKAVVAEDQGGLDLATTYFSVGVVPAAFCTATTTLADLRAVKSCHTAYRRNAGWQIPIGYLVGSGIMPVVRGLGGIADDAESAASFFNGLCASNFKDNRNRIWAPMCSACYQPGGAAPVCATPAERYSDYPGSFRGVMEGACGVAFTKSNIPLENSRDGSIPQSWSTKDMADFRLICPTGGCTTLDNYTACNLGRVPADAVMVRSNYPAANVLKAALVAASNLPAFTAVAFNSAQNPTNAVFKSSTVSLLRIDDDTKTYLGNSWTVYKGNDMLAAPLAATYVDPSTSATIDLPVTRMCTISDAEQAFCLRMVPLMNRPSMTFVCTKRASDPECMQAIKDNLADMRTFASAEMYTANKDFDLKVVVAEDQNSTDLATTYYSVGVVRKEFCSASTTLASLQGKRSCHTAYRRNAGWQIPVGFLLGAGVMPIVRSNPNQADDAESVAAFFTGGSCASNYKDAAGNKWAQMCSVCGGDCTTPSEIYSDYPGSFRGVHDGACDVSFTQSRIPLELSADGTAKATWATLNKDAFRLICPSGGCANVDEYYKCNLGRVPADAVMVRSDYVHAATLKTVLLDVSTNATFRALAFNNATNTANHIFKSSTVSLLRVDDDTKAYLGNSAVVYKGLAAVADPSGSIPASLLYNSGATKSGLSSGGVAGVVIGVSVGLALLAVVATLLVVRTRRGSYTPDRPYSKDLNGETKAAPACIPTCFKAPEVV